MSNAPQRVGVYAGTFDPVHEGHVSFANAAITQCDLDKVFFLVEPQPWRKQGVRALEHREAMVSQAIKDIDTFGMISLDQKGHVTIEQTLPKLQARFAGAKLYLLMGEDVFARLSSWPHVESLLEACSFIVGIREKDDVSQLREDMKRLKKTRGLTFEVQFIQTEKNDISSTKIRQAFRRGWQPKGLLPQTKSYIDQQGLYASQE